MYRLPAEAEWEFACRGGTQTPFYFGRSCNANEANCHGNFPYGAKDKGPYLKGTSVVGSYAQKYPHPFGLSDMHGNVWEWCADWYGEYPEGPVKDPQGPASGDRRVVRGGSWNGVARDCRAAFRNWGAPAVRNFDRGFRVACLAAPRTQ